LTFGGREEGAASIHRVWPKSQFLHDLLRQWLCAASEFCALVAVAVAVAVAATAAARESQQVIRVEHHCM
jgi:hypothetical protein